MPRFYRFAGFADFAFAAHFSSLAAHFLLISARGVTTRAISAQSRSAASILEHFRALEGDPFLEHFICREGSGRVPYAVLARGAHAPRPRRKTYFKKRFSKIFFGLANKKMPSIAHAAMFFWFELGFIEHFTDVWNFQFSTSFLSVTFGDPFFRAWVWCILIRGYYTRICPPLPTTSA